MQNERGETDRYCAIARLHSRTRVGAECKRVSTLLNIHLTFLTGYTRRWGTSIPKIKERLSHEKKREVCAKKKAATKSSIGTVFSNLKSFCTEKRNRHREYRRIIGGY